MLPSPTLRLRLTLWYGGLFLAAGAVLIAANFLLVARNFPDGRGDLTAALARRLDLAAEELRPGRLIPFESPPPRPAGRRGFALADLIQGARDELKADTLEQLALQSAVALLAAVIVSMGLGWVLAGRMLRPLHDISATVARISEQNLDERIALGGPHDELKQLADQFDVMLDRLQSAFEAQREFVANASHELRTPLAIMRTELDVTLGDPAATRADLATTADVVSRAIDRAERLIEQLLLLASADGLVRRPDGADDAGRVDLAELLARAVGTQAAGIAELGLTVEQQLTPGIDADTALDGVPATAPVIVRGDAVLLEQLVGNLVQNAVQHNVAGGWLSIAVQSETAGVALRVANGGAQLPPEQVEWLFQRFSRLDRSRSRETGGYGLGLAIVRAIAAAHGGSATARARSADEGGGLEVTVQLPR